MKISINHYVIENEVFIAYMDAIKYCDLNNIKYKKIIKTKKYPK